jgi:glycosyltransferase involved in cell wall biosynthesis
VPTISVITICYNNLSELLETMASVDKQTLPPFEHLIIDGSSDDIIRTYLNSVEQPVYRKCITERDEGIGDAFNKGIRNASGEILNMLNAADTYYSEFVLEIVTEVFINDPGIMWLHGKYQLLRGGIWVTIGKPFDPGKLYRGMRSLSHQSMFVKKTLHDKYGNYDISLKNAMDYDFVCRIRQERFVFIEKPLVIFAPGGTTYKNYLYSLKEGREVFERYNGFSVRLIAWQWRLKVLHFLLSGPAGKFLYKIKVLLKLENA